MPTAIPQIPDDLAADPRIREAMVQLVIVSIQRAVTLLPELPAQMQIQLIRSVLPTASKALQSNTESELVRGLREEVRLMNERLILVLEGEEDEPAEPEPAHV